MQEVTAVEAAKITGCSERTIRRWIGSGKLKARQVAANRYAIKVTDLEKLTRHASPDVSALVAHVTRLEETQREQQARIQELKQRLEETSSSKGNMHDVTAVTHLEERIEEIQKIRQAALETLSADLASLRQEIQDTRLLQAPDLAALGPEDMMHLEDRINKLQGRFENRIDTLQSKLDALTTGQRPDTTISKQEPDTSKRVVIHQEHREPPNVPTGSMLAAHFAKAKGIHPRTLNDWIRGGKVQATTIDKGGRPEHWLTPAQQTAILEKDRTATGQEPDTSISGLDSFDLDMEVYQDTDTTIRLFKAWLWIRYPANAAPHQKRHISNPLRDVATRLRKDERIPEQATKNDYLELLHRSGYSREDTRSLHNLWIDFLEQTKG